METTSFNDSVVAISNGAVSFGAHLLIQSTLLIAAGLITARLCRGKGVALQSLILRTTLVALIAAPAITYFFGVVGLEGKRFALARASALSELTTVFDGPPLDRAVATRTDASDRTAPEPSEQKYRASADHNPKTGATASTPESTRPNFTPTLTQPHRSHLTEIYATLTAVWVIGAFCLLARLVICHWRIRRLRWQAGMAEVAVFENCQSIAKHIGVSTPEVLAHPEVKSPLLVGLFRPAILLPRLAGPNDDVASREVLLHELAHLARWDCLWHLLGRLATALLFFQPLLWVLARRVEETSEDVCDNFVIEHAPDRHSYARQLVDLAERLQFPRSEAVAGVGVIAFKSALGQRIVRLLDDSRNVSVRTGRRPILTTALAGVLATGMVGFIGVNAESKADAQAKNGEIKGGQKLLANRQRGQANPNASKALESPAAGTDSAGNVTPPSSEKTAPGLTMRTLQLPELFDGYSHQAISRDGRYIVRLGDETTVLELATGRTQQITNRGGQITKSGGVLSPRFSPDGKKVVAGGRSTLNPPNVNEVVLIDLETEQSQRIFRQERITNLETMDWSADGRTVLFTYMELGPSRRWHIATLSVNDGSVRIVKSLERRSLSSLAMGFSPDGQWIVYDVPQTSNTSGPRDLFLLAADGSQEVPLVQHSADDYVLGWAPFGDRVLFGSNRRGSWDAYTIRVVDGKAAGEPELVKEGIGHPRSLGFTREGAFLYRVRTDTSDVYLAALDPLSGKLQGTPRKMPHRFEGYSRSPDLSSDGRFLAFLSTHGHASFGGVIYVRELATGMERPIEVPEGPVDHPRWSLDGRMLHAGVADQQKFWGILQIDAKSGASAILPTTNRFLRMIGWAPDGRSFYYMAAREIVIRREVESSAETRIPLGTEQAAAVALSPDGKHFAVGDRFWYVPGSTNQDPTIFVMPASGGEKRKLVERQTSKQGFERFGRGLGWSHDSRYVFFSKQEVVESGTSGLTVGPYALCRVSANGGETEKLGVIPGRPEDLCISSDGRTAAFTVSNSKSEVWVMENFLPKEKVAAK